MEQPEGGQAVWNRCAEDGPTIGELSALGTPQCEGLEDPPTLKESTRALGENEKLVKPLGVALPIGVRPLFILA